MRDELYEPLGVTSSGHEPVQISGPGVLVAVATLVAAVVLGEAASLRFAASRTAPAATFPAQNPAVAAAPPLLRLTGDFGGPGAPVGPAAAKGAFEKPLAPVAAPPPESPPAIAPARAAAARAGAPEPLIIDVQQALAALKAQDPAAAPR